MQQRDFPFSPRSARDLCVGDFWAVALSDGNFGCLQVTDLRKSGSGSLKTLIAGVIDWRGGSLPRESDLVGRQVLEQGLTRVEAFIETGAQVIGNSTKTTLGSTLASNYRDFHVGAVHYVYGWRALRKIVERVLRDKGSAS